MIASHAPDAAKSPLLRFARGVVLFGLAGAAGVTAVAAALKWLGGGVPPRDALVETIMQGFPLLGFLFGGAAATARALWEVRDNDAYRYAVGVALGAAFLLLWSVLAVGGIGAGGPPDLLFAGVLAVGFIGVLFSRFEPIGMARALVATATVQAVVPVIAVAAGWHRLPGSSVLEIIGYCGFFTALFAGSASLFYKAASEQASS